MGGGTALRRVLGALAGTAVAVAALCGATTGGPWGGAWAVPVAGAEDGSGAPSPVAPPPPGDDPLRGPAGPVLVPTPVDGATAAAPTTDGVRRAVRRFLADSSLGLASSAVVVDPADGTLLYDEAATVPRIPASSLKILTAVAALQVLGPDARLATRVVQGSSPRQVVLVGGGDTSLVTEAPQGRDPWRPASLDDLADATAQALDGAGVRAVRLGFDDSLFDGPTLGPGWSPAFPALGVAAPVTALMVDGGRAVPGGVARVDDPSEAAAQRFADALSDRGITVGVVRSRRAPAGAEEVARVESPTVAELVEHTLTESDNDIAEALAHLVGAAATGTGSFESGAQATLDTLTAAGLPTDGTVLADGSGLSRDNQVPAITLAQALVAVARQSPAQSWPVSPGLPVAGVTGTLADRFHSTATDRAAGVVRAKTGTLTGVSSLAGTVRDTDGRLLVFAFLADDVTSLLGAREAMDRAAARLAACGCR